VDRALAYLASQQKSDGSFDSDLVGQPGVTALCTLAFLSRGHLPSQGPYGRNIAAAIGYILSTQKPVGLLCLGQPGAQLLGYQYSHTAIYNHAIAGLALSEAYGMADRALAERMHDAIIRAEDFTLAEQAKPKELPDDVGGWRYVRIQNFHHSDLSVTSWQLLFLRSAKNAGFAVPAERIEAALGYVSRCFDADYGTFQYVTHGPRPPSRAVAGAGILSLALAGSHDAPTARAAAACILGHGFGGSRPAIDEYDRYFYGIFYATQGMFQLGGQPWRQFFPPVVKVLLAHQLADGSWEAENDADTRFLRTYSTALTVLSLDTPHQLLPIFQR
jgi:hypothetical protein